MLIKMHYSACDYVINLYNTEKLVFILELKSYYVSL
jgi:hypothetical protein